MFGRCSFLRRWGCLHRAAYRDFLERSGRLVATAIEAWLSPQIRSVISWKRRPVSAAPALRTAPGAGGGQFDKNIQPDCKISVQSELRLMKIVATSAVLARLFHHRLLHKTKQLTITGVLPYFKASATKVPESKGFRLAVQHYDMQMRHDATARCKTTKEFWLR